MANFLVVLRLDLKRFSPSFRLFEGFFLPCELSWLSSSLLPLLVLSSLERDFFFERLISSELSDLDILKECDFFLAKSMSSSLSDLDILKVGSSSRLLLPRDFFVLRSSWFKESTFDSSFLFRRISLLPSERLECSSLPRSSPGRLLRTSRSFCSERRFSSTASRYPSGSLDSLVCPASVWSLFIPVLSKELLPIRRSPPSALPSSLFGSGGRCCARFMYFSSSSL